MAESLLSLWRWFGLVMHFPIRPQRNVWQSVLWGRLRICMRGTAWTSLAGARPVGVHLERGGSRGRNASPARYIERWVFPCANLSGSSSLSSPITPPQFGGRHERHSRGAAPRAAFSSPRPRPRAGPGDCTRNSDECGPPCAQKVRRISISTFWYQVDKNGLGESGPTQVA